MSDRIEGVDALGGKLSSAYSQAEQAAAAEHRRSRTRRIAGGAVALAATLLLVASVVGRSPSRGPERFLTVEQAVAAVGKAAFDQPAIPRESYLHMLTRTQNLAGGRGRADGGKGETLTVHSIQTFDQETWTKLGKPELRKMTMFPASFVTKQDEVNERRLKALPYKSQTRSCVSETEDPATLRRSAIAGDVGRPWTPSKVPITPRAAYDYLMSNARKRRGSRSDHLNTVWGYVQSGMMAGAQPLTARQRAALVGSLGYLPGVKLLPGTKDPNGNPAVGFERTNKRQRDVVYFDTRTSLTTFVRSTSANETDEMGSVLPKGTLYWGYELKKYEFVDAPPKFKHVRHSRTQFPILCM